MWTTGSTDSTAGDASRDSSARQDRIRVIRFSGTSATRWQLRRDLNMRPETRLSVIDADLQDPPEVISEFFQKWAGRK